MSEFKSERDTNREPRRFNFKNPGTTKHQKGDIYEYVYQKDASIQEEDPRPSGLIIIDLSSGGVQTADVSASQFDLLQAIYGVMDALELPMEAAAIFPILEKYRKPKAKRDAAKDVEGLLLELFGDANERRSSGIGLSGFIGKLR